MGCVCKKPQPRDVCFADISNNIGSSIKDQIMVLTHGGKGEDWKAEDRIGNVGCTWAEGIGVREEWFYDVGIR